MKTVRQKRRGRGEGSLYRRADGRWTAQADAGWVDGKRKRPTAYGRTRSEAARKLRDMVAATEQGRVVPNHRRTVDDFLDEWLETVIKPSRVHSTYQGYEHRIRLHIKPVIGRIALARLTPSHVQQLINLKRDQGYSARTIQYIHGTLRTALNQALRWDLVQRNVAVLVDRPSYVRPEVTPFLPEEARAILHAAQGHRIGTLFSVALAVGLRPGEALALRWADVELKRDKPLLHVRRAMRRGVLGYEFGPPKTKRSSRVIPLPEVLVAALKKHRVRQKADRLRVGDAWEDNDLIFCTRLGRPLHPRNVARTFDLIQERAGVNRHRLYDTRHTAASILLAQGVPTRVVMEILGHSQMSVTTDTYQHVIPSLLHDAADAVDRALGSHLGSTDTSEAIEGDSS